jgi:hypothetical protein
MSLNLPCPCGGSPHTPLCPHSARPGSRHLPAPDAAVIVVVVLVLAALAMSGIQASQALTLIAVAVADLIRRGPGGRGKRNG